MSSSKGFSDYIKESPETLCMYPVTHINFRGDGHLAPCFRAKPITINNSSENPQDAWNSKEWRQLRLDMINGKKSFYCENCWKSESEGTKSYRQSSLEDFSLHAKWREQFKLLNNQTGEMPFEIKQTELRFSNICNLKCKICSPIYSTQWLKEMNNQSELWQWLISSGYYHGTEEIVKKIDASKESKKMLNVIKQSAKDINYLMITGGEPFIDTSHIKALKALDKTSSKITLEYTSNLNTLTDKADEIFKYWSSYKRIRLKVSIDGDPQIYRDIREGGDHIQMERNIRRASSKFPPSYNNNDGQQKLIILGTCTVSRYNIERLDIIANYITSLGCFFHSSHVNLPEFLSAQALGKSKKILISKKLSSYLKEVEQNIKWGNSEQWHKEKDKKEQIRRIKHFVQNAINYMNGKDTQHLYENHFVEYEELFKSSLLSK